MSIVKQCWPTQWLEAAMRAGFATYRGEDGWEFISDKMRDMLADFAATVQAAERERWTAPVQALLTAHDAGLARVGEQMRAHGLTTLLLPYEVKAELDAIAVLRALMPNL